MMTLLIDVPVFNLLAVLFIVQYCTAYICCRGNNGVASPTRAKRGSVYWDLASVVAFARRPVRNSIGLWLFQE